MRIDWLRIPKKNFTEALQQGYSQSQTYIYYISYSSDTIIRIRKEIRKTYTKEEIADIIMHSHKFEIVGDNISDQSEVQFLKKEV